MPLLKHYKSLDFKTIFTRPFLFAWIVLALSLLFTLFGWKLTKYIYAHNAQQHFTAEAKDIHYHIHNDIRELKQLIQSSAGFANTNTSPTPDEWSTYISSLESSPLFNAVESVGLIRVHRSVSGKIEYKIVLSHPIHPYPSAKIGQDALSNPIWKETLLRSIDRGTATLSAPLQLKDHKNHQKTGAVLIFPVYEDKEPPKLLEEKRKRIIGFVYAPLYIEKILEKNQNSFQNLHVEIYDQNRQKMPVAIFHSPVQEDNDDSLFTYHSAFDFGGRVWKTKIYAMPQFESYLQSEEPIQIVLFGTLLSLLLFIGFALLLQNRHELENQHKTSEYHRQRLEILLSSSADGIYILDYQGKLHLFSSSFAEMLEYTSDELQDFKLQDWDSKLTEEEIVSYLASSMDNPLIFETIYRKKHGALVDVEVISKPIVLDGTPYIYCSVRDITVRIKHRHDLYLFEELLNNSNDMIFIIRMRDSSVEFVNATVIKTLGYTSEELKTIGIEGVRRPLETAPDNSFHAHLLALQEKRNMTDYAFFRCKDGHEFLIEANDKIVSYKNEDYTIAIVRDISRREKILSTLQLTTSMFEEAQRLAKLGSWVHEHNTGKNEWSEESFRILELNPQKEPNLEDFLVLVHHKDRKKLRFAYHQSVQNHIPFDMTVKVILPSKTQKYIKVSGEHFYNHEGKIVQSRGMFHDVTETIVSRQTIENERERLRAIADMGSDWYWENNSAGVLTHISKNISKNLGYENDELIGHKLIDIVSASVNQESIATLNELLRKHKPVHSFILNINAKNGNSLVFELNAEPVYSIRKKFIGYRGIARDITIQHTLQKQLMKQNNELKTIFETSRDGIVITDFQGKFLDFNKAYMDMTGYSHAELMNMSYADITPTDQVESVYQQAFKLLEGEPYVHIIKTSIDKQGKPLTMSLTVTLMPDHQRVLANIKDITEQQQKSNELAETYERLRMATDAANIGIWIWNIHNDTLIWDEKMYLIYNIPHKMHEHGITYGDWMSRIHPKDKVKMEDVFQAAIDLDIPFNTSFRILFDNDAVRYIQCTAVVKRDDDGKAISMVGINRDITNDKTLEQVLIKAKMAAEEANRAKTNFIANMSHEIRTPLNGIIGLTELTLQTDLNELQYDFLKKADQSAKALMNVINDILDYSKIEAGKFILDIHPFNLKELLQTVYDLFEYKALEKHIDFGIDMYADIPIYLEGDSIRLTQVLINLVGNAIKFTETGSVRVKITHQPIDGNHGLSFQVIDTGIGISSDKLKNLFKPFSQADPSFTRKFGGTGLGLFIARELIHLMDGKLTVSSNPGEGSTFAFDIQLKAAHVSQTILDDKTVNGTLKLYPSYHILLVEDNEINQIVATEKLKLYGLSVSIANNGQEAVKMFKNQQFDLILMDLQMPVMDGLEATRQIRILQHGATTPIIALSAAAMEKDRDLAMKAGMNGHLSKPIINSELEKILHRYLSKSANEASYPDPYTKALDVSLDAHSIHFEELKRYLNDNNSLIMKLFTRFSEEYTDYTDVFSKRLENPKDFDIYIQKLKGVSENLHMEKLHLLCHQYGQDRSGNTIHAIEHELENVLFIVHSYLKENTSENPD